MLNGWHSTLNIQHSTFNILTFGRTLLSTAAVVAAWSYFILTGSISQIWPMFGIANQLLAAVALCVGTAVILNAGRAKYAWTTMFPLAFVASTTLYAGWRSIFDNFLRLHTFTGTLDTLLTATLMVCVIVILASSARAWLRAVRGEAVVLIPAASGAEHRHIPGSGCC